MKSTATKKVLKLVELQSLVMKCCKIGKIKHCIIFRILYYMYTMWEKLPASGDVLAEVAVKIKYLLPILFKICKLCRAIFSVFYNILAPNVALLLILRCSFLL